MLDEETTVVGLVVACLTVQSDAAVGPFHLVLADRVATPNDGEAPHLRMLIARDLIFVNVAPRLVAVALALFRRRINADARDPLPLVPEGDQVVRWRDPDD